jgi:flagellar basal body-associated protein FliL
LRKWHVLGSPKYFIGSSGGPLEFVLKTLILLACGADSLIPGSVAKSWNRKVKWSSRLADKRDVKQRLLARVAALKEFARVAKKRFRALWSDDDNALLFRALTGLVIFVGGVLVASGVAVWKLTHPHEPEVAVVEHESPAPSAEGPEGGDASASVPAIGVRPIPKEISKRQDGVPESDKDLVEPELHAGRGLASIAAQAEAPTAPYNPFLTYQDILGSTSEQGTQVGRLAVDVSFEVDSYVAMKELQEREKEVKFVIGSLIGELTYEQLRQDEGRAILKKRIFQEVNYLLKKGKIRDVLYGNYVMR